MYCVIDDLKTDVREAFIIKSDEWDAVSSQYSGYYIVERFDSAIEAQDFMTNWNEYVGCQDVVCSCCQDGCVMTAKEYAYWNGSCAYSSK